MAFRIPTFPLVVNIWRTPAIPPVGPPAVITVGNLSPGRRTLGFGVGPSLVMELLLPAGTDIQCAANSVVPDAVEVPGGSGRFYKVFGVDDVAKGFANQYRLALIQSAPVWPVPYP